MLKCKTGLEKLLRPYYYYLRVREATAGESNSLMAIYTQSPNTGKHDSVLHIDPVIVIDQKNSLIDSITQPIYYLGGMSFPDIKCTNTDRSIDTYYIPIKWPKEFFKDKIKHHFKKLRKTNRIKAAFSLKKGKPEPK